MGVGQMRSPRIPVLLAVGMALLNYGAHAPPALGDREVTVAEGDTLTALAVLYYNDVSFADQIASYNHLADSNHLTAGQVLRLPDRPPQVVATQAGPPGTARGGGPVALVGSPRAGPVVQTGLATWYGPGFEGGITKCGQVFHTSDYTASSNDLPCGAVIQVTNVMDGKSVTVTVDDTGSFRHPTILDLSHAAFTALALEEIGVIEVSVVRII